MVTALRGGVALTAIITAAVAISCSETDVAVLKLSAKSLVTHNSIKKHWTYPSNYVSCPLQSD
jgi:hypothetical protein